VINFLPGDGKPVSKVALSHQDFAGLHFTGSTATFNWFWKEIAQNLVRSSVRVVSEVNSMADGDVSI